MRNVIYSFIAMMVMTFALSAQLTYTLLDSNLNEVPSDQDLDRGEVYTLIICGGSEGDNCDIDFDDWMNPDTDPLGSYGHTFDSNGKVTMEFEIPLSWKDWGDSCHIVANGDIDSVFDGVTWGVNPL